MRTGLIALLVAAWSVEAHAGGLYFSERGVRPLARGGAFVAGADDVNAMWFNPAGLADAQSTLLFDASFMLFGSDYQPSYQVTGPGGALQTYNYPLSVHGSTPPLAIPTLGMAFPVGEDHRLTLGGGLFAPDAPLMSWPETFSDGTHSPSRYSLVSLQGSLLAVLDFFGAYKVSDQFRIGAGLELLAGSFQDVVELNANPGLLGPPQDPSYDALSETKATIITPSGNLGVTWIPADWIRVGLSGQLPFWIDAPATVNVRLPSAAVFTNASQNGNGAGVKFRLPAHIRAGIEFRPSPPVRVEVSYEHQFWSLHDTIDITPHNVELTGVAGFPSPYTIPAISIPRHFQDCDSVHLGLEITGALGTTSKIHARAGFSYESSAVPKAYESTLTVDGDKLTFAGGLGLTIDRTRLDFTFAYVTMFDVDVPPGQAAIQVVNPVAGNPLPSNPINGGHYSASAPILGFGFQYAFGAKPKPPAPPRKPEPPPPPPPPPTPEAAPEVPVEVTPPEKPKKPKTPKRTTPTPHRHTVPAPD